MILKMLQEWGHLPGPQSGPLSITLKRRVDKLADKARDFIRKSCLGGEQEGKETQEKGSAKWFAVSGFMTMRLASWLSLVNHSDSGSFWMVHTLLNQDGCQQEGFWEVVASKKDSGKWEDTWSLLLTFP